MITGIFMQKQHWRAGPAAVFKIKSDILIFCSRHKLNYLCQNSRQIAGFSPSRQVAVLRPGRLHPGANDNCIRAGLLLVQRENCLYLIRLGMTESSPSLRFLSSS